MVDELKYQYTFNQLRRLWSSIDKQIELSLADKQSVSVLDVGCGRGFLEDLICQKYGGRVNVVVTDINEQLLEQQLGKKCIIDAHVHDINTDLPFERESFDIVILSAVIGAIRNDRDNKFWDQIYDLVSPRGAIIVLASQKNPIFNRTTIHNVLGEGDWRYFDSSYLVKLLTRRGMQVKAHSYGSLLTLISEYCIAAINKIAKARSNRVAKFLHSISYFLNLIASLEYVFPLPKFIAKYFVLISYKDE